MRCPFGYLRQQFFLHRQPEIFIAGQLLAAVLETDNVDQQINRFRQLAFTGQLHQRIPDRHVARPELAVQQYRQRSLRRVAVAGGVNPDVAGITQPLAVPTVTL
ncbi:hypothetical protein D3C80_1475430 [compost metagenome]